VSGGHNSDASSNCSRHNKGHEDHSGRCGIDARDRPEIKGKIADFNLVALTSEAAALAQLTEMVNAGWIPIGVYIVTASSSGQARISSGPVRELVGEPQVEKFLTDLVNRSPLYSEETESADWTCTRPVKQVRNRQKKPSRYQA
jgi:hypothetical protein